MLDKNYFPGWVRKSITFSIDDGNIPNDTKFINIVKPYGIKGTFNLVSSSLSKYSKEFCRELYRGFGISNHCKLHPFAMEPQRQRPVSDDCFDPTTADITKNYKTGVDGVYHCHVTSGWRKVADTESYCRLVDECHIELEEIFGKGSVTTFVWPFCEQANAEVQEHVMSKCGYTAVRKTGLVGNTTGYAVPEDLMHWSYNSKDKLIVEDCSDYENFADDGNLKFFCFGLHSVDYENMNCWDVLLDFCKRFGNRPETFYYASVEDIFAYCDAVKSIIETDEYIENPTDITLYVKVDGKRKILCPKSKITK